MARRDRPQLVDEVSCSPEMHAEDRGGAVGNELLDPPGVECVRRRVDVAEDRLEPGPRQSMGGPHECERGEDRLSGQPGLPGEDVERSRAVRRRHAVSGSGAVAQPLLELPHELPVVRQPPALPELVDPPVELVAVAQVRTSDVEETREGRSAAEDREIPRVRLHDALTRDDLYAGK